MAIDRAAMRMIFSCQFWRMAICWTFALLFSYLRFHLRGRCLTQHPRFRFSLDPGGKIRRPICIITGATSGLGEATARAMAAEGYHVVVAGRCSEKLDKIIQDIMKGNESAHLNAFQVDLSSFHSILKFERSFKQWLLDSNLDPSVQLLINNAGILATSFKVSADGYDKMMQTNYLGAFALTNLLLPLLKKSPVPSRIVNITPFTHRCVTNLKLDCNIFSHSSSSEKYPLLMSMRILSCVCCFSHMNSIVACMKKTHYLTYRSSQ
ncbi:hypothetical protein HPP92_005284 [Vanilla planifolia]|uniref:Uncharacterized protein n=1 Tax=Vanilla planifolia TaxID=51239 RepID=A0A835VER0_VANPL|nr:hypothetical protein HPP92_005284 [Vanilla planifolia]